MADVIRISDFRAARAGHIDTRTETERLIDQACAKVAREVQAEAFYAGMQAAMESMRAEVPTMLRPRTLTAVRIGGWAS